ncbi:hypothetical protein ACWCWB_33395, partial [Actinacidiphila glaucinigra]
RTTAQLKRVLGRTCHDSILSNDRVPIEPGTVHRDVATAFAALRDNPRVGDIATQGLEKLGEQFGGAATPGVNMAVRALSGDVPEQRIRTLAPAFTRRLTS